MAAADVPPLDQIVEDLPLTLLQESRVVLDAIIVWDRPILAWILGELTHLKDSCVCLGR